MRVSIFKQAILLVFLMVGLYAFDVATEKELADRQAYQEYELSKQYDPTRVLENGFAAPGLSMQEQAILGSNVTYKDMVANEVKRRQELERKLLQNEINYQRALAMERAKAKR
ncbi:MULTISPECIES: hypothetical protein [Helicobacter]|uniref:Uncharacterized protein n=3 Tax=Helicobacteraceae TaxID=72293 RepID=A0A3D8IAE2_9HELI|nr:MULTISPECIES: hypothetical protein [Helicobacter]RDU62015.1 hypothetical protein CQA43_08010 [Helicobacter ganmani]